MKHWMFKAKSWGLQDTAKGDGDLGGTGGGSAPPADPAAEPDPAADPAAEPPPADGVKAPAVSDVEARLLKEVMQKKESLRATAEKLTDAESRLKQFDGIDADEVRKLLSDKKDAETAQLEAKGEWDRLRSRMAEEHASTTKTLQDQIAALNASLAGKEGAINELTVGASFSQSVFIADELTLTPSKARVVYGAHFELEEGRIVGYDKPRGAADRTPLVDAGGIAVGFDAALRKIVEADSDKDHLLKSKAKSGAGSDTRGKAPAKPDGAGLDSISRISAGLKALNLN